MTIFTKVSTEKAYFGSPNWWAGTSPRRQNSNKSCYSIVLLEFLPKLIVCIGIFLRGSGEDGETFLYELGGGVAK